MTAGAIRRLRISRLGFPFVIGTVLFIAALTIAGLVLSLRPQSHGAMLHLHEARVVTAKNRSGLPPLPPYARFLESDFAPFRDGFEWKQVEAAIQQCANVRIAIIGGQLYTQRLSAVWETRDLFLYLGILDMLHHHEAECPDVYFGVFLWDDPATQCQYSPNSAVAPIFAFSSSPSTGAIMIPDWSYWGWPECLCSLGDRSELTSARPPSGIPGKGAAGRPCGAGARHSTTGPMVTDLLETRGLQ